ncbi:MAG: ATP-binding protein [Deltaproteobacteria bacterium]
MKLDTPVPFARLKWFQEKLGLGDREQQILLAHRDVFLKQKERFSEEFFRYFWEIRETRNILDHEKRGPRLKTLWAQWYELIFTEAVTPRVLGALWRSGLRHVELNIDKRYINLGYAFVRQFFHETAEEAVPVADLHAVTTALDKVVDFCVLIETHAYVIATSQCDLEVVRGISHQVRNPLTVIGGNILRLQKKLDPASPVHRTYETILKENERLEAMVRDAATYSELYQKESVFTEVSLENLILMVLKELEKVRAQKGAAIAVEFDLEYPDVQGDPRDVETMFFYLLQNSIEAADPDEPVIRISSRGKEKDPGFLEIEIFNNGKAPSEEDMENLFVPFYSSKPSGTGFRLPIAQLAAKKNMGEIYLERVPGQGTKCVIQLPVPTEKK